MSNFTNNIPIAESKSPWMAIFVLILFSMMGLFVFQFIGLLAAIPFLEGSFMQIADILQNPESDSGSRNALFVLQGFSSFGGFILGPWAYLHFYEKVSWKALSPNKEVGLLPIVVTALLIPVFMFFNSGVIEWNANLIFPEFLSEFESWAQAKEEELKKLTMFLVDFQAGANFWVALLVIAVLPAIGEELLFRGGMQNLLFKISKNIHISIWIAAFVFSAIHVQFYGFIPRVLLGAVFGYLYVWSGNLLYPIIGHFVNNGLTLVMFYLNQMKTIDFDIEDTSSIDIGYQAAGLVFTILLLVVFKKYFQRPTHEDQLAQGI
jgi:uncharacterized protein